jgi:hypothetical protein
MIAECAVWALSGCDRRWKKVPVEVLAVDRSEGAPCEATHPYGELRAGNPVEPAQSGSHGHPK